MPMMRSAFPKELEEGLNAVWDSAELEYPIDWNGIYETKRSKKAWEEQVNRVGLGMAQFKSEGSPYAEDAGFEGWSERYVMATIAQSFTLTQEALEDNLYLDLGSTYTKELMKAMRETKAVLATQPFNNAFTTTKGDGTTLVSATHPLGIGGTYSNALTDPADISESALEDMLTMIRNAVTDRGLPCPLNPKQLIIGYSNEFTVYRLLNSMLRTGGNDNDINAIKAMGIFTGAPKILRRLTDTDAWFIQTDASYGFQLFQRIDVEKGSDEDPRTGNWSYRARERYVFSCTNPRAIWGSSGA